MQQKKRNKCRVWLAALLAVAVGFLTWFLISFITIDKNLTIDNVYHLPEAVSAEVLSDKLGGNYAIAVDGKTFFENSNEAKPTASTAKMILALAIIQAKPFSLGETGETITITNDDYARYLWYANNNGSNTYVWVGEEISEYDALVATLLASSNNMADSLAVWAFGSLDDYREYAINMLSEYDIHHTIIGEDASGFSDTTTSTPADLAKIAWLVLRNPVLAEIVGTKTYKLPGVGEIVNTNRILGERGIVGVKTGFIGDTSGYCLVSGYLQDKHIITVALLGANSRQASFEESLAIVTEMQESFKPQKLISAGEIVGEYTSWWTGVVPIRATEDFSEMIWQEAEVETRLEMDGAEGILIIRINDSEYSVKVQADDYEPQPTTLEKFKHIFGWRKESHNTEEKVEDISDNEPEKPMPEIIEKDEAEQPDTEKTEPKPEPEPEVFTNARSTNCTIEFGKLMLVNPNFPVEESFIASRRGELVSISALYGIVEGNAYNGDNLLDAEAAVHINDMVKAYEAAYPGHTLETRSCFRSRGTNCGRLCAATGESDHHTGLTCDLLDPAYGTSLDTDTYDRHIDWQWLRANSYKYGFIDRFPAAWAGGPMSEPINVDANGTTGLYETWHFRYVGIDAATDIATGKYNNGEYDSLEHYLKARGLVTDLINGKCYNN